MSIEQSIAEVRTALADYSHLDTIWTSPLQRCRALAMAFGQPHQVDNRLMEVNFGVWEGRSWSEIYQRYPQEMDAWGADWYAVAPPGGESAQMLELRVKSWANSLRAGHHLVFTHAGVIRSLRVLCQLQTWEEVIEQPVPYLGLETFTFPTTPESLSEQDMPTD